MNQPALNAAEFLSVPMLIDDTSLELRLRLLLHAEHFDIA
jgi:hypothetical protein